MKKEIIAGVLFSIVSFVFAQNDETFLQLKKGFLAHDVALQKLQLSYEKALLEYETIKIQEGADITFQTGTMQFSQDASMNVLSLSPSLKVNLPFVQNAVVTFSVPIEIAENTVSYDRAGLFLAFDIFSSAQKERIIALNKAQRSVLEAERSLALREKSAEKEFLSLLQNLYKQKETVFSCFDDYYEQEQLMETLKVQGYVSSSAYYRTQELNLKKYAWQIEKAEKDFSLALQEFSRKCGVSLESLDFMIPSEKILSVADYNLDEYIDYEKTVWTYGINTLVREADKDFSLGISSGYAYSKDSSKEKKALSTGIEARYKGLDITTGVDIPFNGAKPEYSLSFGINVSDFKKNTLKKENARLSEELELADIQQAKSDYNEFVQDKELEAKNLLWSGENYQEHLSLYKDLYQETEKWFAQGIVSEKEVRQARTNYYKAQNEVLLYQVDILLFNLSIKEKFLEIK